MKLQALFEMSKGPLWDDEEREFIFNKIKDRDDLDVRDIEQIAIDAYEEQAGEFTGPQPEDQRAHKRAEFGKGNRTLAALKMGAIMMFVAVHGELPDGMGSGSKEYFIPSELMRDFLRRKGITPSQVTRNVERAKKMAMDRKAQKAISSTRDEKPIPADFKVGPMEAWDAVMDEYDRLKAGGNLNNKEVEYLRDKLKANKEEITKTLMIKGLGKKLPVDDPEFPDDSAYSRVVSLVQNLLPGKELRKQAKQRRRR